METIIKAEWFLPDGFIEKTDTDEVLLYADTDSAYLLYNLPFDKYDDIYKLVDYIQGIARELGTIYNEALEYYLCNFAGLNPKYNTMDFKSEVVAYRGFFNTKKFYSLAKCWDEGTFFEEKPKLKTTGGQIRKSDVTPITKDLLNDVYSTLVMSRDTNMVSLYRKLFIEIKNKYTLEITQSIKEMKFNRFAVPKKWGSTAKIIPPPVTGAKLYNTIMEDTFRPSDSFIVVKIIIDIDRLLKFYEDNTIVKDKFLLQSYDVLKLGDKINVISIPPDMDDSQRENLLKRFNELNIKLDINEIINTNIGKKLEVFEKLFSSVTRRQAL